MKIIKIIAFIVTLFMCFTLAAQADQFPENLYKLHEITKEKNDLEKGSWYHRKLDDFVYLYNTNETQEEASNLIHVRFYVTKSWNKNKKTSEYPDYRYLYRLKAVSYSKTNKNYTSTWLYGTTILINGGDSEIGESDYFDTIFIPCSPITIIEWYTDAEDVAFNIGWTSSAYDPRGIK
jgi:hypothetical protein